MHRRAFLLGTITSLGLTAVARSGTLGFDAGELRGSLVPPVARPIVQIDESSAALQSAVDKAARAGRPLYLTPGRYEVSNIRLPHRTRLVGVPGETWIVYSGGGRLFYTEDARTLALEGLSIDGANRALTDEDDGLLSFAFVDDLSLSRLDVIGSAGHGVSLTRSGGRLSDCRVSGARGFGLVSTEGHSFGIDRNDISSCLGGGIHLRRWTAGEDGASLTGNRLTDLGGSGIRLDGASGVRVSGNDLHGMTGPGIVADAASTGAAISGNTIDGAALGIALLGGADERLSMVEGNMIRNMAATVSADQLGGRAGGVGIHIEAHGTVTGNVVEEAPHLGLSLGWGAALGNVVASGNIIRRAGAGIGVSVLAPEQTTVVTGNLLVGVENGAVRGMRFAEFATDDLMRVGTAQVPGLTVGENRVA